MDGLVYDSVTGEVEETPGPDTLRHWNELFHTDPKHTKQFQRAGGFKGTAIKPIWNQYRLTEHFGPCGVGWGTDKPEFQVVEIGGEMLVYCTLRCWYMDHDGKRAEIFGVGGDKVMVKRQTGIATDDEAFKKAFTDALGNAFVRLGVSADVHMGLFENSKYVADQTKAFSPAPAEADETIQTRFNRRPLPRLPEDTPIGENLTLDAGPGGAPKRQGGLVADHEAARQNARAQYVALRRDIRESQTEADVDALLASPVWDKVAKLVGEVQPDTAKALMDALSEEAAKRKADLAGGDLKEFEV